MNRLMKASLFGGLISLVVIVASIIGCSEDIVLEPLPSLLGEYEGVFIYTENLGASNQRSDDPYYITWRFSDQNYWVWWAGGDDHCICEPSGEYSLASEVELIQREEGCAGCVFDESKLPAGTFTLRQPTNENTGVDSIIMTQIIDDVMKEIRLVPATDN